MASRPMKYSGIQWIGKIPENWEIVKYKRFATSGMGSTLLKEDILLTQELDAVPVYSATQTEKHFGYLRNPKVVLNKGDLVIPARGNSIGHVKIIKDEIATCTQTTIYSKINKKINGMFLYYCSKGLKNDWFFFVQTAIPQITVAEVQNNLVPYPPNSEQQKIASFLDEKVAHIDNIIEDTKESIEYLKAYKQSLITETVTKGLSANVEMKDSGIELIGEIPRPWEISKLGYLGNLQNGISKGGEYFGTGYPFVSYGDVYRNWTLPSKMNGLLDSTEKERELYSVYRGDVFFTRTSETIQEVGFSSVCEQTIPNATFAGFLIRFRPTTKKLTPDFSKYYFRSSHHRDYYAKEMNLVTRASLGQGLLKSLPVLLPSVVEQQQIADYLDEKTAHIDSLLRNKEKMLGELESYKKSLIYEYVTGKKEVK